MCLFFRLFGFNGELSKVSYGVYDHAAAAAAVTCFCWRSSFGRCRLAFFCFFSYKQCSEVVGVRNSVEGGLGGMGWVGSTGHPNHDIMKKRFCLLPCASRGKNGATRRVCSTDVSEMYALKHGLHRII